MHIIITVDCSVHATVLITGADPGKFLTDASTGNTIKNWRRRRHRAPEARDN